MLWTGLSLKYDVPERFFEVVVTNGVEAIPHIEEAFHLLSDEANGIERAIWFVVRLGQLELDRLKNLAEAKFNIMAVKPRK